MPGKKASEELRRGQIVQAAFQVATREGLEQLTIRLVAAEAGLSTGLVFFHFKSKEILLLALLDWVLDSLFEMWDVPENLPPVERLLAWLQLDLQDLSYDGQGRGRLKLFLSYWMLAVRDPTIAEHMKAALERSRQTLLPIVQAVLNSESARFRQMTAEGLVTVVIALAQGCSIQSLFNNSCVDTEQILTVIRALLLPSDI